MRSTCGVIAVIVVLLCMSHGTLAAGPEGIWEGGNIRVTVKPAGGAFAGQIEFAGDVLPFENATADPAALRGQFKSQGQLYDFALAVNGDSATLTSGGQEYALKRAQGAVAPGAPRNAADVDAAINAASAAMDRHDYAAAWKLIDPLIAVEDARALFLAGLMVQDGLGTKQDLAKANELYARSSDAGFAPALGNLGVSYREGRGVTQNFAKALECFREAAMRGDSQAAVSAGALFVNGQGTEVDYVEGWAWYTLSSDELARKNMTELEQKVLKPEQLAQAKKRSAELLAERDQFLKEARAEGGPGTVPIVIAIKDGKPVLTAVKPGSRALENGLEPGDVLHEIDGKSVAGMSVEQIQKLLAGPAGSSISLRLTRGDGNVMVVMPREAAE